LQAKIITAQQLSAWKIRRERVAIDSRFWASMTMSAIAAVIALVIVSVVPHYAAKSLPSRILNTNPSVDANTAAPINAAPLPVKKSVTPVRKTETPTAAKATAAKTDLAKADSAKTATNPKAKHANDDYVAPNTYKYYGNGSKASH
jgi:ABC-type lipoprotein release transport system permease subunit